MRGPGSPPIPAKKEAQNASDQPPEIAVPDHPECVIKETPSRMLPVLIDLGIYPPPGGTRLNTNTRNSDLDACGRSGRGCSGKDDDGDSDSSSQNDERWEASRMTNDERGWCQE